MSCANCKDRECPTPLACHTPQHDDYDPPPISWMVMAILAFVAVLLISAVLAWLFS